MKKKLFIGRLNKGVLEGSDGVVLKNRFFSNYIGEKIPLDYIDIDMLKEKRLPYIVTSGLKLLSNTLIGGVLLLVQEVRIPRVN